MADGSRFPQVSARARHAYADRWDGGLLDEHVRRLARDAPSGPAVVDGSTRVTHAELADQVAGLAAGLRGLGVVRGDVVSMQLPNWWEAVALHLAVVSLGAVSNPVMPILRERDLTATIARAGTKVLVVPAEFRGFDHGGLGLAVARSVPSVEQVVTARGSRDGALTFGQLCADPAAGAPTPGRSADDPVVLLYTSGTESTPKGAIHSHNTLGYEIRTIVSLYELGSDDVVWAPSPVAHITGVLFAIHLPTMIGAPVVLQDVWDPTRALDLVEAERCTFVVAATPFLHGITHHPQQAEHDLSSLRVFVCGGADVPPGLIRAAGQLGVRAMRLYGSTEIPTVTSTPADADERLRAETDGRAIADAELRVVDDDGVPVPSGTPGRLLARGPETMLGYLDVETQPFDEDGWIDTGDLGRIDADGYLTVVGRSKDIIVRGGENISAKEIEDLLHDHPAIADVAVVAVPDPRLAERACAVVVLRPDTSLDLAGIVTFLDERRIARQKCPERLEFVDRLPKTPTGKVQKFALRELVAARAARAGRAGSS